MTDKQIIIDGCDVSGCEFYKNTNWKNCYSRDYKESVCQSNHNCYYKQLKAKEQECEELKNDKFALEVHINSLTSPVNVEDCEHSVYNGEYVACRYYEGCRCDDLDFANCMFRENVRLKQQLDQLNAELEQQKALKETYLACYKAKHQDIEGELFKLKQTLTEIEQICEPYRDLPIHEFVKIIKIIDECEVKNGFHS